MSGNLITSAKTLLHGRSIYDVEDMSSRLSERMSSRPNLPEVSVCRLRVRVDLFRD